MTRFLLTAAFGLALALPSMAQQPQRPRENDEVAKLRAEVRELEAQLKNEGEKKGDKKPDVKKDEPKGPPPMGGAFDPFGGGGFPGGPPMGGGFGGPPGGGGRGGSVDQRGQPDRMAFLARMPGMDKLTKDEQATFTKLIEKMREPSTGPARKSEGGVEARLDRLEKAIADLAEAMKRQARGPGAAGRGDR